MTTQAINPKKRKLNFKENLKEPFFNTIVVGADFSKHSIKVFKDARSFGKQWHLKVGPVHIANISSYGPYAYLGGQEERSEKGRLERELKKFYKVPKFSAVKSPIPVWIQ